MKYYNVNGGGKSAAKHFAELWDTTFKKEYRSKYGWDANPWVWVIKFIPFVRVGKAEDNAGEFRS